MINDSTVAGSNARGKSMLAQSVMIVVFALGQSISLGTKVTAFSIPKEQSMDARI